MNSILLVIICSAVSGKVFNIDSNEPLQAHIYIESLKQIFPCDSMGEFLLSQIPPGNYNLVISHIGFKEESLEVELLEYDSVYLSIGLKQIAIPIEPVEVETEMPTRVGVQTITQEEIQTIPGAEKDIFRSIQTLPGVNAPSDYFGLIYVRGGELYENQVFFDGIEILSPFHHFGFGSVFNIDLIKNFEFYSGTFPARYGGAMSSVVSIESKKPGKRIKGNASLDLMEANWLYICPVTKNLSFIFSSKRNYLDLLLKNLGVVEDVILPYYIDHHAKIFINSKLGTFSISGLKSEEATNIETTIAEEDLKLEIDGNANSIAVGWNKKIANNIDCQANLFYSDMNRYLYGERPGQYGYSESSIEEVDIKKYGGSLHTQFESDIINLEIGGGVGKHAFMHTGPKVEDILYGTEIFGYSLDVDTADSYKYIYSSQHLYILKPLICEFGERIDWFPVIKNSVFSPRVKLIYNRTPNIYFAYGYHHQIPPFEYDLTEPNSSYARSLSFGTECLIKPTILGKIEVYHKKYCDLITKHYSDSLGTYFRTDGYGSGSGIEISLRKYKIDNYWGWISYSHAVSKRTSPYDSNLTITRSHRPHIFNLVFGISFANGIDIGIKFLLASGAAYDEVIGKQWGQTPSGYEGWIPVCAPEKSFLPTYQRFDIHIEKNFSLLGFDSAFYITVLNLMNHRNVQDYFYSNDLTMRKTFYMIPRVPLVGLRLKF